MINGELIGIYRLVAVLMYKKGAHYTSDVRCPIESCWLHFDDMANEGYATPIQVADGRVHYTRTMFYPVLLTYALTAVGDTTGDSGSWGDVMGQRTFTNSMLEAVRTAIDECFEGEREEIAQAELARLLPQVSGTLLSAILEELQEQNHLMVRGGIVYQI